MTGFVAAGSDGGTGGNGIVGGRMRSSTLPNGIRVLTESIPGVRSVSLGVWVRQGSVHERPEESGASHLLEHMVFKGTGERNPREIAMALERLGGSLDAFTSREHTSYQARVLSEHLPVALDVLSDLVLNPVLRKEDLELEREVVLEEISTVEDTPDDLVFELHGDLLWGRHPYGRSILGSRESVGGLEVETLQRIHRERYRGGELIVAAAGHLEHERILETVEAKFGHLERGTGAVIPELPDQGSGAHRHVERTSAQTHIVFGARTPPRSAPERIPLVLLSSAFGGGMSSRLFQRIREELALAYTVYSFQSFYSRAGVSGVYVGTRPEWTERAIDAIREEMAVISNEGLPLDELREVKDQVKGQVMLSLESTSARLFRLAGFALYDQPYLTLDQLLNRIETVSRDEVAEVARTYLNPEVQAVLRLGPA
ncbi:MAG: insulinase family protein [Gemmatimonadales bacterium]|nr:MAG: insulinase family protein [Gemmatimonadales bacterium]